jgi:hypothetical protein
VPAFTNQGKFLQVLDLGGQNTHPHAISILEKALQISAMVGADTTALNKPTSLQFIFACISHFSDNPSQSKRLSHSHKPKDNWGEKFE